MEEKRNSVSNESDLNAFITELRQKFLDTYTASPQEYDPIDVESVETNDFQIKRFLTYNNMSAKQAFDQLVEALKWKKSSKIKRDFSQLGVEIFHSGGLFISGQDREGRPVFYARIKTHMRVALLEKIVQVRSKKIVMIDLRIQISKRTLETKIITTIKSYYSNQNDLVKI